MWNMQVVWRLISILIRKDKGDTLRLNTGCLKSSATLEGRQDSMLSELTEMQGVMLEKPLMSDLLFGLAWYVYFSVCSKQTICARLSHIEARSMAMTQRL